MERRSARLPLPKLPRKLPLSHCLVTSLRPWSSSDDETEVAERVLEKVRVRGCATAGALCEDSADCCRRAAAAAETERREFFFGAMVIPEAPKICC